MKRFVSIMCLLFIAASNAFSADHIDLVKDAPPPSQDLQPSRSTDYTVSASKEAGLLFVDFSCYADFAVQISSSESDASLLEFESLRPCNHEVIDISSLQTGSYILRIYAFGEWWIGYFEID